MRNLSTLISITLSFVGLTIIHAKEPIESDFYKDSIDFVSKTVNVVDDYGANGSDDADDSKAFRNAINAMTALAHGGKIIVPAGTFHINKVELKSNVHLVVNPQAILKPNIPGKAPMFKIGSIAKNSPAILNKVYNVSIRCSKPDKKFTVDYSDAYWQNKNINFVNSNAGNNFLISDFHVKDNVSAISCVTINHGEYNGEGIMSKDGLVKNISGENMHYGYGIMQMKAGTHIFFKDLDGEGGATLRLESGGGIYTAPANLVMDKIFARNITCTNGKTAAMVSPHTRNHGSANIANVTAINCGFAAEVGGGFVAKDETGTPGTWGYVKMNKIHAVYGSSAQLKSKHYKFLPCELKDSVATAYNPDGSSKAGPAIAAVLYDADPNDAGGRDAGDYDAIIKNASDEGFVYQPKTVINEDDILSDCKGQPVSVIDFDVHYKLYPNPCSNFIRIESGINSEIQILSIQGKRLKSMRAKQNISTLVTSELSKGLYVVQISSPMGNAFTKFVKN